MIICCHTVTITGILSSKDVSHNCDLVYKKVKTIIVLSCSGNCISRLHILITSYARDGGRMKEEKRFGWREYVIHTSFKGILAALQFRNQDFQ